MELSLNITRAHLRYNSCGWISDHFLIIHCPITPSTGIVSATPGCSHRLNLNDGQTNFRLIYMITQFNKNALIVARVVIINKRPNNFGFINLKAHTMELDNVFTPSQRMEAIDILSCQGERPISSSEHLLHITDGEMTWVRWFRSYQFTAIVIKFPN